MGQAGLNLQFDQYKLVPNPAIAEPFIWIKEIRFYGDGFSDLRRAMKLRKGMNILWSTSTVPNAEEKNNASGHAAGKSLFCRMIRYILGEPTFAIEHTAQAIRNRYINGIIAAEIGLNGEPWLIVRPVGLRQKHTAYSNTTFEMLIDGTAPEPISYKDFLERLNRLFMHSFPLKKFPNTQEDISWEYIYPLLTRDQECHLSHPLNWREAESESEAKNPSYEKNSYIVRGFISDISTPEQDLIQQKDVLDSEVKKFKADLPSRKYHNDEFRKYLEHLKLPSEILAFEDSLMYETAIDKLNAQIQTQEDKLVSFKAAPTSNDVLLTLNEAKAEEAKVQQEYDKRSNDLSVAKIRLKSLQDEKLSDSENQIISFDDKLKPAPSFRCNTPLHIALQRGCPCCQKHEPQHDAQWEAEKAKKEREIVAYRQQIADCEMDFIEIRKRLEEKCTITHTAMSAFKKAQADLFAKIFETNTELLRLQKIRAAVEQGFSAFKEMTRVANELEKQCNALDDVKEKITDIKKKSNQKERLKAAFSDVLKHIVNDKFYGQVSFDRNSMQLEACCDDKDRESAAYKTINSVAIDYAMLLLSIEGIIPHPRFLLHDSPRESDMDDKIYHSLFEYIKSVENVFAGQSLPFQYIITTTTEPPKAFQTEPYLLPILDASIPEKRLLGVDL